MPYIIDGYNVLHALGLLRGRTGPHGLEKARLHLLGMLSGVYGDAATTVTVVFDAHHPRPGVEDQTDYHGLHVRYAAHHPAADDLIEELIRHDAAPRQLTVVSDDHRLRDAARRRHCRVVGCLDYLDELDRQRRKHRSTPKSEEGERRSAGDAQRWLEEFADLGESHELRAMEPFAEDSPLRQQKKGGRRV